MRGLLISVVIVGLLAPARAQFVQERTATHGDWTVTAYRNAWDDKITGSAASRPVDVAPRASGKAEALLLCVDGKPRLGISWPAALDITANGVPFSLRTWRGAVRVVPFAPYTGRPADRLAPNAPVYAMDETVTAAASIASELAFGPGTHRGWAAVVSTNGLSAALSEMSALCSGRAP